MAEKSIKKYQNEQKYIRETYKWVNVQFNTKKPDEIEMYEWLKSQKESQAATIKNLIRKEMSKTGE